MPCRRIRPCGCHHATGKRRQLVLPQFFLNNRCFLHSERPERVGKSPADLQTGQTHPHWLEMLGYTRFSQDET